MNDESLESRVLGFDNEFAEIMSDANELVSHNMRNPPPHRYTAMSVLGLMAGADSLKLAIIALAHEQQFYGASALYRSLIEHYLRCFYLVIRWMEEKNDDAGSEYVKFSRIADGLEYAEACKLSALLVGNESDLDPVALMKEHGWVPQDMTKRQISDITAKWKYRNVIRYLSKVNPKFVSKQSPFLVNLIPVYAELSSFVHGGAHAMETATKLMVADANAKPTWEYADWACILANSLKIFFFIILAQHEKQFLPHTGKLMKCLNGYLKTGTHAVPRADDVDDEMPPADA